MNSSHLIKPHTSTHTSRRQQQLFPNQKRKRKISVQQTEHGWLASSRLMWVDSNNDKPVADDTNVKECSIPTSVLVSIPYGVSGSVLYYSSIWCVCIYAHQLWKGEVSSGRRQDKKLSSQWKVHGENENVRGKKRERVKEDGTRHRARITCLTDMLEHSFVRMRPPSEHRHHCSIGNCRDNNLKQTECHYKRQICVQQLYKFIEIITIYNILLFSNFTMI